MTNERRKMSNLADLALKGAAAKGEPCGIKMRHLFGLCDRPTTVEREGRWFCWQHDPERVKTESRKRWAENRQRLKAEDAEREARFHRLDLLRESGVRDLTNDDLERIIVGGGIGSFLPWLREAEGA